MPPRARSRSRGRNGDSDRSAYRTDRSVDKKRRSSSRNGDGGRANGHDERVPVGARGEGLVLNSCLLIVKDAACTGWSCVCRVVLDVVKAILITVAYLMDQLCSGMHFLGFQVLASMLGVMVGGIQKFLQSVASSLDCALDLIGIAICTVWEGCTSWCGTREDICSLTFVKDFLPWAFLVSVNMDYHWEEAAMFISAMVAVCILVGNWRAAGLLVVSFLCIHQLAFTLQQRFVKEAFKGWSARPDERDLSIFWVIMNIVAHVTTGIIVGSQAAEEQCNGIIFPWEGKLEAVDDDSFQKIITCRWPCMALLKGGAFKGLRDWISELLCEMHTRRDDPKSKTFSCTYSAFPTQISMLFCLPVSFAYIFWAFSRKITWWDFFATAVAPATCFGGGLMGMYQFYSWAKAGKEMRVMANRYSSIFFMFGFFFYASHLEIEMMHINDGMSEKMFENMYNWWTAMFGMRLGFTLQVAKHIRYLGLMCACSSYQLWRVNMTTQLCLFFICGPCVARYMIAAEGVVQMSRIVIHVYFPWSSLEAERIKLVEKGHLNPGKNVGFITNENVPMVTRLYCRAVDRHGMDPKSAGHAAVTIEEWEHNFRTNRSKQNCRAGTHQYRFYRYMLHHGCVWKVKHMLVAWMETKDA